MYTNPITNNDVYVCLSALVCMYVCSKIQKNSRSIQTNIWLYSIWIVKYSTEYLHIHSCAQNKWLNMADFSGENGTESDDLAEVEHVVEEFSSTILLHRSAV